MAHRIIGRSNLICLILVLLGFPATASAQADGLIIIGIFLQQLNKVADLSLGFSMARAMNPPSSEKVIPLGIQFGTTFSVHRSIGIDADIAIQSRTPPGHSEQFNMFEYLFGPRFSVRTGRSTVFGHILAGGVHHYWNDNPAGVPATGDGVGFAMAYGGGIDVNASERIAIRVVQFDWIPIREDGSWKKNTMRIGIGIVIRSAR